MGGFFIATNNERRNAAATVGDARPQFRLSGFGDPVRIEDPDYILDYYPKHGRAAQDLVRFGATDFIASVGTFIFGNKTGADALRLFFSDQADRGAALAECRGQFALIERRAGQTTISRDALGAYEVYRDREFRIMSTSFLALARSVPRRTVSAPECVEYVANGVTFGTKTPVDEIQRLDIADSIIFDPTPRVVRRPITLVFEESADSFAEQLAHSIGVLRTYVRDVIEAFGGQVRLSFSGGYDSRLLLALLRVHGMTPDLFVYGGKNAHDVRIAKQITTTERIPLQHIDKDLFRPVTLDNFPKMVEQNFHWNDGLPCMGLLISNAEITLRAERSQGDVAVLSGGGGEVFRDYFKFPERELSARDFVRCFFSGFDPGMLKSASLHASFEEGLAGKVDSLLGAAGKRLDRRQVDSLYPHFRCRTWFGHGGSVDSRFGNLVLPYYDRAVLEATLRLPLRWRRFGNFQSRMIRELDPNLARYVTSHGFALDRNTPLKGMIPDLLLYSLPPWLRRHNYRIKQRLRRPVPRARTLAPPFLSAVLDTRFPFMSRIFDLARVRSDEHFERIATLEYLFHALNADTSG